jgi:hypothetical protein
VHDLRQGDRASAFHAGLGEFRVYRRRGAVLQVQQKKPLVWLDLCSGLGGASQPALDRGWKVIRVDIDPRFKPDIVADVRYLPLKPFHVDVLWASPPCTEFSKFGLRCFYPNPPEPDLSICNGVRTEILRLKPRFWIVENVWSSRPWLRSLFGPVRAKPPGHALWSNLLLMLPNIDPHKGPYHGKRWQKSNHHSAEKLDAYYRSRGLSRIGTGHNGMDAAANSQIPYEIGEAICAAVERRVSEES